MKRVTDLNLQIRKDGLLSKRSIERLEKIPRTYADLSELQDKATERGDEATLGFIAGMAVTLTLMDPENQHGLQVLTAPLITESLDAIRQIEENQNES